MDDRKKTEGLCITKTSQKEKRRRHLGTRVLLSQLKQMRETGWTMPLHPWTLEQKMMVMMMMIMVIIANVNNDIDESDNDTWIICWTVPLHTWSLEDKVCERDDL